MSLSITNGAEGPPVANLVGQPRLNKKDRRHTSAGNHDHNGVNSKLLPDLEDLLNPIAAKISKDTAQTILDQTEATINFNTVDYNRGGNDFVDIASNRLKILIPGLYTFKYYAKWSNGNASTTRKAFLYVGGNNVDNSVNNEPVGTANNFNGSSINKGAIDIVCSANQFVLVKAWHNNGAPLDISAGNTWLSAICVRRD